MSIYYYINELIIIKEIQISESILKIDNIVLREQTVLSIKNDIIREANLLVKCDHLNIVKFHGTCYQNDIPRYLVMEYMNIGDLRSYLIKNQDIQV
jgi:serine/threonine protein kinase